MDMHGGPVWQWRPHWLGRRLHILMLVKKGYAVFLPNPRGSAGRGQGYSRLVLGDLGGADTYDYLSGIDHLIEQGLADPQRLGVMGHSYGGYMAAWLISQDQRFAAAILSAPMTNYISQHLLSNISHFVTLFLDDHYKNPQGKYLQRSPVTYAHQVTTPTLNICGALDRCTPAAEAIQFHHALLENQVHSVLVNYPQEGHGIRGIPELIDYSARILSWIKQHIPQPDELSPEKNSSRETKERAGSEAACPNSN
jgi:dipeptidyl aminopeptidase/acylaminoacyl peptidase